jgi:hypothetical protein
MQGRCSWCRARGRGGRKATFMAQDGVKVAFLPREHSPLFAFANEFPERILHIAGGRTIAG